MPNLPAIWTADWHLRADDRVWSRHPDLMGDTAYALSQLEEICDEWSPEALLLGGDIFDTKPQRSDVIAMTRNYLESCERRRMQVLYVQGQHELSNPPVLAAVHDWPRHIHGEVVALGDFRLAGLDYTPPAHVESALQALPSADVLLTHQVWRDLMSHDTGDAQLSWVSPDYSLVLTGDYHKRVELTLGDLRLVSPGPLCMQRINETDPKGVYLVHENLSLRWLPLRSRQFFAVTLHTPAELDVLLSDWDNHPAKQPQIGVPPEISRNILRVWTHPDIPDAAAHLARLANDVHLFVEPMAVQMEEHSVEAQQRVAAVQSGGAAQCIREFYADDPEVTAAALSLLDAPDVPEAVNHLFWRHTIEEEPGAETQSAEDSSAG